MAVSRMSTHASKVVGDISKKIGYYKLKKSEKLLAVHNHSRVRIINSV